MALIIETSTAYGRGVLGGIAEYARQHGPWSFFMEPGMPARPVLRLGGWQIDGVIVALNHLRRPGSRLAFPRVPVVDLDYMPPHRFPRGICNDEPEIGRLAADHLMTCGLRHFAFCGWGPADPSSTFWEVARRDGFVGTLRARQLSAHIYQWPARRRDWSWAREQKHLGGWLSSLPTPVGIMASNDQRARHVLEAARLANVRVPEDVAVIGVDNDPAICEICLPPLTSISLNTGRLGFEAAAALATEMRARRKKVTPTLVAPLGVAARRSTDILAVDDPAVAAALQYIRANTHRPLQVADLQRVARVSRRSLELRFRSVLGWSPHDEIYRVRLARLKELLIETDWPLKKVSEAAGFTRPEHMHSVFRREIGVTPSRYRARSRSR